MINDKDRVFALLNEYHLKNPITVVISGNANGVDKMGELWAKSKNIPVEQYIPNWDSEGKKAGYLRNVRMAKVAEACVTFMMKSNHSKGTTHMLNIARDHKLLTTSFEL